MAHHLWLDNKADGNNSSSGDVLVYSSSLAFLLLSFLSLSRSLSLAWQHPEVAKVWKVNLKSFCTRRTCKREEKNIREKHFKFQLHWRQHTGAFLHGCDVGCGCEKKRANFKTFFCCNPFSLIHNFHPQFGRQCAQTWRKKVTTIGHWKTGGGGVVELV